MQTVHAIALPRPLPMMPPVRPGLGAPLAFVTAALLCMMLESVPSFDRFFQAPFFTHGVWLVSDAFHTSHKAVLYTGPKVLIGITGGVFFLLFAALFHARIKHATRSAWEKPALLVFLSIALIPLAAASLKALTGVHGPVDLQPYGGVFPHTGFVEQFARFGHGAGGRSFPAGHASGGFALMALCRLPVSPAKRKALFLLGFTAGWGMGLYQMARGEHFLSHTLTTMFLALAIISCLAARGLGTPPELRAGPVSAPPDPPE